MNLQKGWLALLILLLLAGCNLPTAPTEESIPPLDQTITALFKTAAAMPPTETPVPPTATSPVTATPRVATSTAPAPAPSNTPPPTNTIAPPTATQPSRRSGLSVEAVRWSGGLTLDGDWSEWKSVGREYPATNVVYGAGKWSNEDDLAGSFYAGWDGTYLYIAAKVRDEKYVQNASGQNIYKGDSLELLIDANLLGDFYTDALNSDDYQIGISPGRPTIGDGNAEAYLWYPAGKAGSLSGVKIAARDEGDQYRVEAAIPWSVLGITPQSGLRLGFAFSVSDNDASGDSVQESMVSSATGRHLTDPTTWHDLVLK